MLIVQDIKSKNAKGLCATLGCSKSRHKGHKFCYRHEHQLRIEKDPQKYYYGVLRRNARRRNVYFAVTLDHFRWFCDEYGYIDKRGKLNDHMQIDRDDPNKGYVDGNLKPLTGLQNKRKYWIDKKLDERYGTSWREPVIDMEDWPGLVPVKTTDEDVPF